jgi:hypothetical protein
MNNVLVKFVSIVFRSLTVCFLLTAGPAFAQEATGDSGRLIACELHIVVHVMKNGNGGHEIEFRSPDQGDFVLPAQNVEVTEDHLCLSIPKVEGS